MTALLLPLDSPRWAALDDAYGRADKLPALLRSLREGDGSVLGDIVGAICHQGSIYGASYAALPHLVEAARSMPPSALRNEILIFVGMIRSSRDDRSREAPADDVARAFEEAIPRALELALGALQLPLDDEESVYLLQAAAALRGLGELGKLLEGFVQGELVVACEACGMDLYVWPDDEGLRVFSEDPIAAPTATGTRVTAGAAQSTPAARVHAWLQEHAGASAWSVVGEGLPYLLGSVDCPGCGEQTALVRDLGEARRG